MFDQNYSSISKISLRAGFDVKNDNVESCSLQGGGGQLVLTFIKGKLKKHFLWRGESKFDLDLCSPENLPMLAQNTKLLKDSNLFSCLMASSNGWNFLLIIPSHNSSACSGCATLQSNCSCLNLTDPLCYSPLCLYTILSNSQPRPPCGRFPVFSMCYLPVCSISRLEWCKAKGK